MEEHRASHESHQSGQFQARTPDGQLCSNGLARNDSLNQPGPWKTTKVGRDLTIQLYDQASHGADYFRVYVSKQGFNPTTQSLGWANLDFITQTGRYAPALTFRSTSRPPVTPGTTSSSPSGRPHTSTRPICGAAT